VIHVIDAQPGGRDKSGLYQLKITLKGSKPSIWRRVLVPGNMRLSRLHDVIQIAMGWTDSHLHQFIVGTRSACTYFGVPDPEATYVGDKTLNERRYAVADLAPIPKKKFIYEYDFGDGWEHEVIAEKILPRDPVFKCPVCLAGANACPPEDCGGIYGYYNKLDILADPKHPEHEDIKEWIGEEFDSTRFDLSEINAELRRLKKAP
jgi:Plasmid pRiA4b ORF-3-like protein